MDNKKSVKGIMLDRKDNVAIVTADTMPGDPVFYCQDENHYIVSRDNIETYRKHVKVLSIFLQKRMKNTCIDIFTYIIYNANVSSKRTYVYNLIDSLSGTFPLSASM